MNATHISDEHIQAAKDNIQLFDLASRDTALKRAGLEYHGACPFCGGRDRFYVKPDVKTWGCRNCSAGYHDAISYIMKRDSLGFIDAVKRYADAPVATDNHKTTIRAASAPKETTNPVKFPLEEMQPTLREIVDKGRSYLLESEEAQTYLQERGIFDSIDRFSLGYSPDFRVNGVRVYRGLLFPHIIGGRIWGVKIRRLPSDVTRCPECHTQTVKPGETCGCGWKYSKMISIGWTKESGRSGGLNITALYHADSLLNADTALVCEGEIDCITLAQELSLPVATLCSVSNQFDVALWGIYALNLQRVLVIRDNDEAGKKLTWASDLFGAKAVNVSLPAGVKDPNDLLVKHDKLFGWAIKSLLTPGQLAKFRRAWQEAQTWNVSERGAVRLAWLHAIGKPAQGIPAGEAFQEARRLWRDEYGRGDA